MNKIKGLIVILLTSLAMFSVVSSEVNVQNTTPEEVVIEDATKTEVKTEALLDTTESESDPHQALFDQIELPRATECATCHPKHFKEWSVSQHAYAMISPVFQAMHKTINDRTSGTTGDFCIRCHTTGMQRGEGIYEPYLKLSAVAKEGVTCVSCHRQNQNVGKISGRMGIIAGGITESIYGPTGNENLKKALNDEGFNLVTEPDGKGRKVHQEVKPFFAMLKPGFCGACHDVTNLDGFRLEEAFSEFKHSEAAKQGITCQDCHMGNIPGKPSGYGYGPAAVVAGNETEPRRLTNHYFAGPDYPVVHPALFPHNPEVSELAELEEWLNFDVNAGWGTESFENNLQDGAKFPEPWDDAELRYEARELINSQLERLDWAKEQRDQVLKNGYQLSDISVRPSRGGFAIKAGIVNATNGHNVPTGFSAERLVFLQVTVKDASGAIVYQSGDRDPNGDVRDLHSLYVHDGLLPLDHNLLSLQSRFLVRGLRGGEREQVLAVNRLIDPRPFLRPSFTSSILLGGPSGGRIHKKSVVPGDTRWSKHWVDKGASQPPYRIHVALIAQMVPVNLVHDIQGVGFELGESVESLSKSIIEGAHVVSEKTIIFDGKNAK